MALELSKDYVDPNDPTRAASFGQQQEAVQQGIGAFNAQIGELQNTGSLWDNVLKSSDALTQQNRQAIERQAARALFQSRGSLGGGGGLATVQNADAQNAYNIAQFNTQANASRAQLAQQASTAKAEAQGSIAAAAGNKYKIMQEQQNRQNRINDALSAARDIVKRYAGTFSTNEHDRQKMADAIRSEVLATETDPEVIKAVDQFISQLGTYNSGSIGDRIKSIFD